MGILKKFKAPLSTKSVSDPAPYFEATVPIRDRNRSRFERNIEAIKLIEQARGYPLICADIVAKAGSRVPMRMFRVGGSRQVINGRKSLESIASKSFTNKVKSGAMGRKAASLARTSGEVFEVERHPLLDLMMKPNDWQDGESHDYQILLLSQLACDMYHLTIGTDGSIPSALLPMLPQYTNPMPDVDGIIGSYSYGHERSGIVEYKAKDVLHFKHAESPFGHYRGHCPMAKCYQAARIIAENEDFDYELIDSGNIPMAFISLDPSIYDSPALVREAEADFRSKTRGISGKLRAWFGATKSITFPGTNSKELQTIEKLNTHKATVRNAFGVPEALLELNSANLASATVGDDQFWGLTVQPLLDRLASFRTETLMPMAGMNSGEYFFAYDNTLLSDQKDEMLVIESQLRTGQINRNQANERLNLDPVPGGETYYLNGVPLDDDGKPVQQAVPASPGFVLNDNRTHEAKSIAAQPEQPEQKAAVIKTVSLAERHRGYDKYDDCGEFCTKSNGDDDVDSPITANPPPGVDLTAEQLAAINTQRARVVAALGSFTASVEGVISDSLDIALRQVRSGADIDLSEMEEQVYKIIEPEFRDMYRAGYGAAGADVGGDIDFDPFDLADAEAIEAAQQSLVRDLSVDILDHTAQQVEGRVRAGLERGSTVDEIADSIESDTNFPRYRAERIARTEVMNASNAGKMQRLKDAGAKTKFWIPGTSLIHRKIARMFKDGIPIDQPFFKAGDSVTAGGKTERYKRDIMHPPARPNCTCTIATQARPENLDDIAPEENE